MGADYSFYVKFITTRAPTFIGYIISVLVSVQLLLKQLRRGNYMKKNDQSAQMTHVRM